MQSYKTYRIAGIITVILFCFSSIYLYVISSDVITLFSLTKYADESSLNTRLVYMLIAVVFILGIVLFFLLYKIATQKETSDKQTIDTVEEKQKQKDEEERIKLERDKQTIEEARKNTIIEQVLRDLKDKSLQDYSDKLLTNIAKEFEIVQGLLFVKNPKNKMFKKVGSYAYYSDKPPREFKEGEGLSGQVAKNKKLICIDNVPETYITILSGLGNSTPNHLLIFPVLANDEAIGIIELASFKEFSEEQKQILRGIGKIIGTQLKEKISK